MTRRIKQIGIEWDKDYGAAKRTGWSIQIDGSFYVELEPSIVKAIWKAWRLWRVVRRDPSGPYAGATE